MSALAFRPRRLHFVISAAIFLASLVATAALRVEGDDTFWWLLAHDFAQAVGAAALAVGGVGAALEWRAMKRWQSPLQVIAVGLLDKTIRYTGAITSRASHILLGDDHAVREISEAFQLPWTSDSADALKEIGTAIAARTLSVFESPAGVVERVVEWCPEVASRSDGLWAAAVELEAHIEADHAMPLLRAVSQLHRHVRELTDEASKPAVRADLAEPLAAILVSQVFDDGIAVAKLVEKPFKQLRRNLRDRTLLTEIAGREQRLAMDAETRRQLREARDWEENWERETDRIFRDMNAGLDDLRKALSRQSGVSSGSTTQPSPVDSSPDIPN